MIEQPVCLKLDHGDDKSYSQSQSQSQLSMPIPTPRAASLTVLPSHHDSSLSLSTSTSTSLSLSLSKSTSSTTDADSDGNRYCDQYIRQLKNEKAKLSAEIKKYARIQEHAGINIQVRSLMMHANAFLDDILSVVLNLNASRRELQHAIRLTVSYEGELQRSLDEGERVLSQETYWAAWAEFIVDCIDQTQIMRNALYTACDKQTAKKLRKGDKQD